MDAREPTGGDGDVSVGSEPAATAALDPESVDPATTDADVADGQAAADDTAAVSAAPSGPADTDEHSRAVKRWREVSAKRNRKSKWPFWIELPVLIVIAFLLTFLIQTFIARVYYVPSASMEQTLHGSTTDGDRILAYKLVYDFRDPAQGDVVVFKGPDSWAPEVDIAGPSNWLGRVGQALGSVIGIAPANEKDFVKRVIAVGGQQVSCCSVSGAVEVNGIPLHEPYIYQPIPWNPADDNCTAVPGQPDFYESRRCFAPFTVPSGQLWVMGDHRDDSSDSSYYCQGLTPQGVADYPNLALGAQYPDSGQGQSCARPIPVSDVIGKAIAIVLPPSRWNTIGNPDLMANAPSGSALDAALPTVTAPPVPLTTASVPIVGGIGGALLLRLAIGVRPRRRRRRRPPGPTRHHGRRGRRWRAPPDWR